MKLFQYQDFDEGGMIPLEAIISIGDILELRDHKPVEHYVAIKIPLPWITTEYRPGSDRDVRGPAGLLIFFATGIAPMGRWRLWYHVISASLPGKLLRIATGTREWSRI